MSPEKEQDLLYKIALTFVKDVGIVTAFRILKHFDNDAEAVFKAPLKELKAVSGLGEVRAKAFKDESVFIRARQELRYIRSENINVLWYFDDEYPGKLKECTDAPLLLYYKGQNIWEVERRVAVIGTRKYTDYGQRACENLIEGLKDENILIVSGLAHGIDTIAHKAALGNGLNTLGVIGNGFKTVYPAANKKLYKDMIEQGGVLTEYPSDAIPSREHFPMRNRVVAGLCDVTVVIESDRKGGALITARCADSYNREVAAYPGRAFDAKSSGCNELIRTNMAAMVTCAQDLLELMNWDELGKKKPVQKKLFINLTPDEQMIYDALGEKDSLHADELLYQCNISNSKLAATLLQMEMQGLIKALPGKHYRLD